LFWSVFEPGEKIEKFKQIPAVMQSPGNRRKIFQADGDVMRIFFEDTSPLVLS